MRVAVVGHVEWIEFVRVAHVPARGEIVHALEAWPEAAGGGAVAAAELGRLAGGCTLYTALGEDELGHRAEAQLAARGLRVEAAFRAGEPQRRGFTYLDAGGERTITVIGERLGPRRADPLPWERLAGMDAVYFVSGDAGAVEAARAARVLVATARSLPALAAAGVRVDALVRSGSDEGERYVPGDLEPPPDVVVVTAGRLGGTFRPAGGEERTYQAAELPGPLADTYGAGDSFAAGLTFALGAGLGLEEALAAAARSGAAALVRRGAHEP